MIDHYWNTGIDFDGVWSARPHDILGIGFAYTGVSSQIIDYNREQGFPVIPSFEGMLEVSYTAQIMQGLTVQPDFQYFWNPGGHSPTPKTRMCRHPTPPCSACAPPSTIELAGDPACRLGRCFAAGQGALGVLRMSDMRPILIAGPTASGKSGLALRLAERLGGIVINADSMQVYRELRILTARPAPDEEARVPHALYGFVRARELFGRALRGGRGARHREARARGRRPIIVGGTGLYFKVLLEGLSPVPPIDPRRARTLAGAGGAATGAGELHAVLAARDPEMAARLMPTDPQRIVRALEVLESTGRSLAEWQRRPGEPVLTRAETSPLLVVPERAELRAAHRRALRRDDGGGALEEVRRSWRSDLDRAADHAGAGRGAAAAASRRRAVARGRDRGGQARDPPIRQAAADLAQPQYDCVESYHQRNKWKE